MTAKIYDMRIYRLKKELKDLELHLASKVESCEKHGYNYLDHYTLRDLNYRILVLKERIKNEQGPA